MNDETKAALFSAAYVVIYTLCILGARLDLLLIFTGVFAGILAASAKLEKAEKRLTRYKQDADRRGREEMEQDEEVVHEHHITMTRGKSA